MNSLQIFNKNNIDILFLASSNYYLNNYKL